ncbi:MAG: MFS transporter [Anaerolineae bacterium]
MRRLNLPMGLAWPRIRYRLRDAFWARARPFRLRAGRSPRERTEIDRNIQYLYVEIFWAAIFSAVFAFNATYALRLGATNQMVGWLSSIPSLFAMVMMVPAARFLEGRTHWGPWMVVSLVMGRFGFLLAAFIPWLFPDRAAEVVIYLFMLRTIPITFFNTGFSPLLADVLPARDRARVFANRSIISSAVTAVTAFLAGRWLDAAVDWTWAAFPLNYQLLYVVGGISALTSAYFVSKIKPPVRDVADDRGKQIPGSAKRERLTLARLRGTMKTIAKERQAFLRLITNTLIFNLGAWLVMPLYTILFVRQLNASDSWIGLNSTLANLGVIAGYAFWRRGVNRLGDHRALRLTVPLAASYAFLVAFFPNLSLILVWGILINLINSGVNLSHTNVFYQVCPEERRASYMAIYSSVMNAGAFVCPMIGVALSEVMDIRWVLLIGGMVRLLGAFMFHIWRIDEVRTGELQTVSV